jgi:predicted HTH domain antitoxin
VAKFDPLIYLKNNIEARVLVLRDIGVAKSYNNPNLEIAGLKAIINLLDEVKTVDETRWGRAPLKSKKNLSWIFVKHINPILSNIVDAQDSSISQIQVLKISERSKVASFLNFASFLSKYNFLNSSEISLVSYIVDATELLLAHYSPRNTKRIRRPNDYPFCTYCYRECYRSNVDVCDQHMGANRSNAKKTLSRYSMIMKVLDTYNKKSAERSEWFNAIALNTLRQKNISAWASVECGSNKINWLKEVLKRLDIYNDDYTLEEKAQHILKNSTDDITFFPNWPSALNGTMLRFQAYQLAKTRHPTKKMAERLNEVWSGKDSVMSIASKLKLQRTGLQRQVGHWRQIVVSLRSISVPDDIIKITLGLDYLPKAT